ncbi:polynucleotide kinase 3'-phosphatase [Coprinopsis cinerea AmutBmut pab1-1]|nr:polynucleotide kinase 3'-phosphatase [Coprinopsis cinerea AmutBmut pab1-1]
MSTTKDASKNKVAEGRTAKKRSAKDLDNDAGASSSKIQKVHPFFQQRQPGGQLAEEETGPFKWLQPLGPNKTCLHGVHLTPVSRPKVAAFDLDGTVIKADIRNTSTEWHWWAPVVPKKLREVHESGFSIVFISNQAIKPLPLKNWKEKVKLIANALGIPFRIFAANTKDQYRKPMPGMWDELEAIFAKDGVTIDRDQSFFVGDAAGRIYSKSKSDFASTDRKWAINVGLPFQTPEEYFLGLPAHENFSLPGFNVSSLPELPDVLPSSSALLPKPSAQEIVLFTGPPCVGKSTFYKKHFKAAGYTHINQDTLKTRAKCVAAVLDAISRKESCVIDNTNRDVATRKHYIDVAKKHKIPIRCFHFTAPVELAWHNNLYRAFIEKAEEEPRRSLVPYTAVIGFKNAFEEPTLEEGFSEIRRVNWNFEGTEEERKRWSMWLQIDGK